MANYNDRYLGFRFNGGMNTIPGIVIPDDGSDKQEVYIVGRTRMDKLSQKYYRNPYSGWLIMLANPQFGGLEFKIPDQSFIRIPFPFDSGMLRYKNAINKHIALYGTDSTKR
jgi:hypothetical protein